MILSERRVHELGSQANKLVTWNIYILFEIERIKPRKSIF